ncbi:MAG: creatininase family protein [Phycisphaeraceae bacterium]|nr:creatininase family protein [Phycisphaeraceae bacterium]
MSKAEPWRYEKLTWPQINDAVKKQPVVIVPIGSIEQHGPHLPLDVDMLEVTAVAHAAARLIPREVLVMPTQCQGYTGHVMDFPGTINIHYETLIRFMVDIGKSLAYHGFKKIVYLNGHGSNAPNMDLAARRVNLETDAEALATNWWSMLTVDKDFMPGWRESVFPGGCAHACELETSLYLHLDEESVHKDKIADGYLEFHRDRSSFRWVDLFAAGPGTPVSWTASYTDSGVLGEATLATKEKGKRALDEASRQLAQLCTEFRRRVKPKRGDHHDPLPTFPMPWGQTGTRPTQKGDVHDSFVKKGHGKTSRAKQHRGQSKNVNNRRTGKS